MWKILGITTLIAAVVAGTSMFWGFRVANEYTKDLLENTERRTHNRRDSDRFNDEYSKEVYDSILEEIAIIKGTPRQGDRRKHNRRVGRNGSSDRRSRVVRRK